MNFRHMRYFVAVAEEKSFSRAAERLHLSQPPLSTQIKLLEEELGVALLVRSSKGVGLTLAGEAFYSEARTVLARVEHAKLAAKGAALGECGRLSLGFVSIAAYSLLPSTLKTFCTRYPGVELQLHEETSDVQVADLLGGRIDLGIALSPVDETRLTFTSLKKERLILALPEGHERAKQPGNAALAAMAQEPFIIFPRPLAPGLHDSVLAFCRQEGFTPRISQHAKQMQTIVSLVSAGLGVALVPESLRNLQRRGVVYQELVEEGPLIDVGIVHRKDDPNPILHKFAEVALESIPQGAVV